MLSQYALESVRMNRYHRFCYVLKEISHEWLDDAGVKLVVSLLENSSANQNPYHNEHHMVAVALRTQDVINALFGSAHNEYIKELRFCSFLAGAFHDLDHKGSSTHLDSENVRSAYQSVKTHFEHLIKAPLLSQILDAILVTEYPYKRAPTSLVQLIVRDSDLLMILEKDWKEFFEGLKTESGSLEMTEASNKTWLKKQTFFTKYAQDIIEGL